MIAILVLILAVDQILSFADVLHKPQYRVIQKVYEPAGKSNFTELNFAIGIQFKEEFQQQMSDDFTSFIADYLTLRLRVREKVNG